MCKGCPKIRSREAEETDWQGVPEMHLLERRVHIVAHLRKARTVEPGKQPL
jgi:hypothetical protein